MGGSTQVAQGFGVRIPAACPIRGPPCPVQFHLFTSVGGLGTAAVLPLEPFLQKTFQKQK